jgi:hypothetical protein
MLVRTVHVVLLAGPTNSIAETHIKPLKTKHKLFNLKTQFVPRSKHFSSRLKKQINLFYTRQKSLFAVI